MKLEFSILVGYAKSHSRDKGAKMNWVLKNKPNVSDN